MSNDPDERYRRSIPEKGFLMRKTSDPIDEDDLPVVVGVDPAGEDSDYSELLFVDNGKLAHPVLTLQPQPINLSFRDDNGNDVGTFEYNKEKKQWTFDGNADAAAKVFAKFMYSHFQSILEGDRDGILTSPILGDPVVEEESEPEKVWPTFTPGELEVDDGPKI